MSVERPVRPALTVCLAAAELPRMKRDPMKDQLTQARDINRLRQIEHHRFPTGIEPNKVGTLPCHRSIVVAGKVALWPFNLDHLCAGDSQASTAQGCCHCLL